MFKPTIAQPAPYAMEVEAGRDYYWCACGESKTQPLCDGSHAGTTFLPVKFTAKTRGIRAFCGCKVSENQPLCDGSHATL